MNHIVKWTNILGLIAAITLIYWVFCSISITVFDFKVFRENITLAFFISVSGILFVMMGSLMLNIMANLTRISESLENRDKPRNLSDQKKSKASLFLLILFVLSFPAIFSFLYIGDQATKSRKEHLIQASADGLVTEYSTLIEKFGQFSFTKDFVGEIADNLSLISKTDENFPNVSLIILDQIENHDVFLRFTQRNRNTSDNNFTKTNFIFSSSTEEREYLTSVFKNKHTDSRYSAHKGHYELYYPVKTKNGMVVLYLSERSRYGKIGS